MVNTLELKVGDVVYAHGCRFLLTKRHEYRPGRWERDEYIVSEGVVVNFHTTLLERAVSFGRTNG